MTDEQFQAAANAAQADLLAELDATKSMLTQAERERDRQAKIASAFEAGARVERRALEELRAERDRIAAVLAETQENIEAAMGWLIAIISERDRTSVEVMAKSLLSRQRAKAGLP